MSMTKESLKSIKEGWLSLEKNEGRRIVICGGTGCVANGSLKVYERLCDLIKNAGLKVDVVLEKHDDDAKDHVHVSTSGCQGFCQMGPLVSIEPDGILYTKVKAEDAEEIVEKTVLKHELIERLCYKIPGDGTVCSGPKTIPFYNRQHRYSLALCGKVDPADINEYIAHDGYAAAAKAYTEMTPEEVCVEMETSGLRGRGGGGFPTGRKWRFTLAYKSDVKYVICNADEGDPGAFMDRSVMEGNPHSVLEGMLIAARAIEANKGYIYVRLEYPLAVKRVRQAVLDARKAGLLGDNIFGTGLSFDIEVMEGAGAFVCGEETALMGSIEGRRGMPSPKPPFPAEKGLWGKPTVINNVETLATVPLVILNGAKAFREMGTETSPGTKTFALTGHVANTGLIEVPFGTTLREIVYNIGGGVTDDQGNLLHQDFKAVQIGGPSGGCLTPALLDLPISFDDLRKAGAMVGSGGLVVMNQHTCMVKIARFFMQFTQRESCGKCVLCREGTRQLLALLDDIIEGRGTLETLDLLEELSRTVVQGSLCGLGKTAPNPVLSTLSAFRKEYEAHVVDKYCPAGQCRALLKPSIDAEKCKGCTMCSRKCPVGAIEGKVKTPHTIDPAKCIKCGVCKQTCKFGAISGI